MSNPQALHSAFGGRAALQAALIIGLATAAGAISAAARGLPWQVDVAAVQKKRAQALAVQGRAAELRERLSISLDELRERMAAGGQHIFIDARPAEEFAKGHLLVEQFPPTLNIEPQNVHDRELERVMQLVGLPLVIYCTSDTCELGDELVLQLEGLGFDLAQIEIYYPGWEGIQQAGLPTATGPDGWTGFDAVPSPDESAEAEPASVP